MAGKRVRFHPEAEQEFLASLNWYRERSLIAAIDFERAVTNAAENIALAPQRWPSYFRSIPQVHSSSVSVQHCVRGTVVGDRRLRCGPCTPQAWLLEG